MDWRAVLRQEQARPVPVARLEAALRDVWPHVTVTDTALLRGGLASVLHRIDLSGGPVDAVVLRRLLPAFGDDAATVRREVAVHDAARGAGVPVPRVHWADPDGDVLGGPALVLDHVPGRLLLGDLARASAQRALAAALHDVHAVPGDRLGDLPLLADVTAHADRFGPPGSPSTLVDGGRVERAIRRHERWFRPERVLVHGDLHAGNVLWDGEAVTAVLDWPGAAIGVGAFDEAYAWVDTALAHGRAAADGLQAALDAHRRGPEPTGGEVRLWRAVALRRALPTPGPWAEAYRAADIDVTDEVVEERFVRLVDDQLERD